MMYWTGCVLQLLAFVVAVLDLRKRKRQLKQFNSWTTPVATDFVTGWTVKPGRSFRSLFGRRWRELEARLVKSEHDIKLGTRQVAVDLKNTTDLLRRVSEHQTQTLRQLMAVDKQAVAAVILGVTGFVLSAIGGAPSE